MNLSSLTSELTRRAPKRLHPQLEINTPGPFSCFNSGSVEIEVGEFLYGLVRILKPARVLETGTHYGVSTMYMAQALHDNEQGGHIDTIEFNHNLANEAALLWADCGLSNYVRCYRERSLGEFTPDPEGYEMAFLDTEPEIRFDEFVHFWPSVKPGAIILIHDLHPHLGHTRTVHNGIYDWPYGDFRPKLGPYITSHQVQVVSFPTPRGFTMFQKVRDDFSANALLLGQLQD